MGKRTDFADGIQDARARLMVRRIDERNVGIVREFAFNPLKIGDIVNPCLKINRRESVCTANIDGACRVCTIIDDKHLFILGQERVQAHVHIERA